MPRGLVSPVGSYSPGLLRWGPAARPIQRIPVQAYSQRISGVPLVGGQAQTTIGGWAGASGSFTSPAAFRVIAQTPATIPPGSYLVTWSVTLAGTLSGVDANNMRLVGQGPTFLAESVNPAIAGTYPQGQTVFTVPPGPSTGQLSITAGPTGATSGAVYSGTITGQGTGLVSVGPSGLGNVWYPASATVLTTTGVNDFSTCSIYLGPAGVPITLQATLFPGGTGTASLAIPSMTPGQYLIAQWTSANPGDLASLNITGTMDSVMP